MLKSVIVHHKYHQIYVNLILRACFKMINNYKILICNFEISPERVSLNKCEPDPETRSINHLGVMEWGG